MTAILTELRELDAAHARGDITAAERDALRAALIRAIPAADADPDADEALVPDRSAGPRPAPVRLGHVVLGCLALVLFVTGAATLLFVDFTLALTLGITVLAAVTVALFRNLEED